MPADQYPPFTRLERAEAALRHQRLVCQVCKHAVCDDCGSCHYTGCTNYTPRSQE